jgi:hypothetical protein
MQWRSLISHVCNFVLSVDLFLYTNAHDLYLFVIVHSIIIHKDNTTSALYLGLKGVFLIFSIIFFSLVAKSCQHNQ